MCPTKTLLWLSACYFQCAVVTAQPLPRLTLVEREAPLLKVLQDIQDRTGYTWQTDDSCLAIARPVSVNLHNALLTDVLDSCLGDASLYYLLIGHSINIGVGIFVRGRVVDEQGQPVASATVSIQDSHHTAIQTDEQGRFHLRLPPQPLHLVVTSIGYQTFDYRGTAVSHLLVQLHTQASELGHVVISNGFDHIPKDRAAGAFSHLNTELIARRVSPNLLDRMDGITSGLLVNTNVQTGTNQSAITIRGRSTIFSNPDPLLVIDNFPYNGDVNNINPEDVESITVLKDAAAASLWGTRAANGVIVLKTKQGSYDQPPRLSFTTSFTGGGKPDIDYTPILSSADYIGMEEFLFQQGFYNGRINSLDHPALSSVVELLLQQRQGLLSAADTAAQLQFLRHQDTRRDLARYWYQPSSNQQYWLSLSGGSPTTRYWLSGGLDKDLANLTRNAYNRITVNGSNTYQLLPRRLELSTSMAFTASTTYNNNTGTDGIVYPYVQLVGPDGAALPVPYQLREGYVDTVGEGQLLDWHYRPLDELHNADNVTRLTDWRLDAGLHYTLSEGWQLQALYRYGQGSSDQQDFKSLLTYSTRNLINDYTQVDALGRYSYPIPVGGILDETLNTYQSHNGRLQLNYTHTFGSDHDLRLLAGSELQAVQGRLRQTRVYGYDPASQTGQPVSSYTTLYNQYPTPGAQATIPYPDNTTSTSDHYWSYYANGGYQYRQRYTLTASARLDQSNLFGVNINRKSIPLWSAGLAWELSQENFYMLRTLLPLLKLRLTNGYNGNVYKSLTGYTSTTATTAVGINLGDQNFYGAPYALITNPPNPNLRWEQVNVTNAGLDFATKDNRVEGSFDYYTKSGRYLIGQTSLDPTSGNTQYTGNVANMLTHGLDLDLRTNATLGSIRWQSAILFSYVRDKVTRYFTQPATILTFFNTAVLNPLVGRPLYSVYALRWTGLDPQTGAPMGLLNGHSSENYSAITQSADFTTLLYKGPINPPFFGSWRNTFTWKQWGLSVMLTYKFGNYFSRPSIQYYTLFNGTSRGHPDFDRRWQKPGDEQHTYVPAMPYPANSTSDAFYQASEVLIEKGDLIRLQDLQLYYDLPKKFLHRLQSLRFYAYANHLALLWTANRQHIDPDAQNSLPTPLTLAIGIKLQL